MFFLLLAICHHLRLQYQWEERLKLYQIHLCWELVIRRDSWIWSVENWSSVINKKLRRVLLKTANCRVEGVGNHCRGPAGVSQPRTPSRRASDWGQLDWSSSQNCQLQSEWKSLATTAGESSEVSQPGRVRARGQLDCSVEGSPEISFPHGANAGCSKV